jgi:hypothetical protein
LNVLVRRLPILPLVEQLLLPLLGQHYVARTILFLGIL